MRKNDKRKKFSNYRQTNVVSRHLTTNNDKRIIMVCKTSFGPPMIFFLPVSRYHLLTANLPPNHLTKTIKLTDFTAKC